MAGHMLTHYTSTPPETTFHVGDCDKIGSVVETEQAAVLCQKLAFNTGLE
jgi:hypothetical protein